VPAAALDAVAELDVAQRGLELETHGSAEAPTGHGFHAAQPNLVAPWKPSPSACAEFCERYDQNCFDPDYESLPLDFFEPLVRRVFAEPRYLERG
jgi:hypothetical protein